MLIGFVLVWATFFALYHALPYVSSGAEVVYRGKLAAERRALVFAPGSGLHVMIFGNSKILAGFIPDVFDSLARASGHTVTSFNSAYPARSGFVPELQEMLRRGTHPDLVLLTMPWRDGAAGFDPFNPIRDDHALAEQVFPFRYLLRDTLSFLLTSSAHGGPVAFYRQSRDNVGRMLQARGYYFIAEQSHYAGNRLPADFHLPSDTPERVLARSADPAAGELRQLDALLRKESVRCLYVPLYYRAGEAAPAPPVNADFREIVRAHLGCAVVGPDYLLLGNADFSDETHLNPDGAREYTRAIFSYVAPALPAGS